VADPQETGGFSFHLCPMKSQTDYTSLFWLFNFSLAGFKLLFASRPEIDLFTEEAQYWLWSQNLDWQYYSKPPMVAVLNFISTTLIGHTEIAIRLIPILFGMGSAFLIFSFAGQIYQSEKTAFWAGMVFLAMPITLLEFTFHTTDTSMSFFWILAWYGFYKAVNSNEKKYWILTGFATALGILSKSTMLLIFPAGLIYLIFSKQLKKHFNNFILFVFISLLGFVPGIIWNFQHEFYTFKHIATLGGANTGGSQTFDFSLLLARTSEYLVGQVAIVSVFFLPFFWMGFKRLWKTKDNTAFLLALPGLLTFVGFGVLSFKTWVEVNWPGFAYSTFAILLAPLMASTNKWSFYRSWAIGISLGLVVLLLIPNWQEWKSKGPVFKAEKAIFKRMVGYNTLGTRVQFLADSLGGNSPVIFSESYHTASELAFYMSSHPQTLVINMGSRKNQWDLWPGMEKQVGNTGRFIFVSRAKESPEEVAKFEKLLYEEELPYHFGKDSIGKTKIQIWEHLLDYNPVQTGRF
jgi:4-amino-4-deoxy-L-arabinose transferase-like glycosyltransferase